MPKYQEIIYGSGLVYGEAAKLAFSAEPVTAVALSHSTIQVTWAKPANSAEASYTGFRIVRNQDAFPETEEDGVILYEFFTTTDALVEETSFIDGEDEVYGVSNAPLVSGRFSYYRAWILLAENGEWVRAGDAYTLLPDPHYSGTGPDTVISQWSNEFDEISDVTIGNQRLTTTHDRLMDLIPRVYLSANQGPLDAIREYDPNVDDAGPTDNVLLNQFLKGFSLTADEILTYAELIAPDITGRNTDPNILKLQSHQLNLSYDTSGISRTQKKMVREAMYTYRRKGTLAGLQTAIESITGYDVVLTESKNLMLSPQDSTFYKGIGFWNAGTGCTIESTNAVFTTPDLTDSPLGIDFEYSANVKVASVGASIYNGYVSPITRGIPVTAGLSYTFSFWVNYDVVLSSGEALATASIRWFNRKGELISTTVDADPSDAEKDWVRQSVTATAPTDAVYAGFGVSFNRVSNLWYIDMVQFERNSSVTAYEEARGVTVQLNPKKVNYILDPSFEGDLATWTIQGASSSAVSIISGGVYDGPVGARSSLKKLRVATNSTGFSVQTVLDPLDPIAGMATALGERFYTLSFYAKSSVNYNAHVSLQTGDDTPIQKNIQLTTAWQRFYVTSYATDSGEIALWSTIWGSGPSGKTVEIDCVQLEESYYPTDYFDGNLTSSGGAWNGTANASSSVMYPGINTKLTRLINEIEKYLPINTPYRVNYTRNAGAMTPPKGIS
jgi:hypothetical protein